jgi:hypothetical protein
MTPEQLIAVHFAEAVAGDTAVVGNDHTMDYSLQNCTTYHMGTKVSRQ